MQKFSLRSWCTAVLLSLGFLTSCGDEYYQSATVDSSTFSTTNNLSEWDVAKLLVDAGFKAGEIHPMICIARYESALRTDAIGYATQGVARGSKDIGVFQINSYYWARSRNQGGCGFSERQLFDPIKNAQCARMVFERHGFDGWVAFKKHRTTCQNYVADLHKPNNTVVAQNTKDQFTNDL